MVDAKFCPATELHRGVGGGCAEHPGLLGPVWCCVCSYWNYPGRAFLFGQFSAVSAIRDGNEPIVSAMTSRRVSTKTLTVVSLAVIMHVFLLVLQL